MSAREDSPSPIMAGVERQIAHFRADPLEADATPHDVISVADAAGELDRRMRALLAASQRALQWSERQGGHGIPNDAETELRAAIAKATGEAAA